MKKIEITNPWRVRRPPPLINDARGINLFACHFA